MGWYFLLNLDTCLDLTLTCANRHDATYAVNILTACTTEMNHQGHLRELKNLQDISKELEATDLSCLPELIDYFETTRPHGDHLCFVLRLQSTDVSSFSRTAPSHRLLLHDVQMVVLHVLTALRILHKLGLIHTGIYQHPSCSFQKVLQLLFRCQAQ